MLSVSHRRLCSWALDGSQKCDPSARNSMVPMPANCKSKPATGSFAGMWHLRMPFLFVKEKQKWACGPERRNGGYRGNLP